MANRNGNNRVNLEDYITVAQRIQAFYEKYPDGVLRSEVLSDDGERIVMRATAYRDREDDLPGVGHAEEVRGIGPINKTNALENCETSAWGRAIAALGFEVSSGVQSREEIEQAQAEEKRQEQLISGELVAVIRDHVETAMEGGVTIDRVKTKLGSLGITNASSLNPALASLTTAQAKDFDSWLAAETPA